MQQHKAVLVFLMFILLMAGCRGEKPPLRVGFIGGISGGNADLGQAGRNGAMLAVEEVNRSGGINVRKFELVIRDDANDAKAAKTAARSLVKEKVAVIIGPFTTTMAEAARAITEPEKMLLFSPTASAIQFTGKDDYFFRLCSTTTDNAEAYAHFLAERRGLRRISMVIDKKNYTFAQSWTGTFKKKAGDLGCEVVMEQWYETGSLVYFESLVKNILAPGPEAVLMIANAVDVARIAQQFRKVDKSTKMVAVEWAGTQQLIELGGRAVNGMEVLHIFDMFGQQKEYLRFVKEYKARFNSIPSFSSIIAYETAGIIITALKNQKDNQSIKQAVLANGPYEGLQQTLKIDPYGDCRRKAHFVIVNGNKFEPAPQ